MMLPKKLKPEKLLIASKEKVNNILMRLETKIFLNHLLKEESASAVPVKVHLLQTHNTPFEHFN
jgi:hypothetical protein